MIAKAIMILLIAQVVLAAVVIYQLKKNSAEVRRLWQVFADLYGMQGPQNAGEIANEREKH